jgi:hypothetical protein
MRMAADRHERQDRHGIGFPYFVCACPQGVETDMDALHEIYRTLGTCAAVPDDGVAISPEVVARARQLDAEYPQEHGRAITRDRLRAGIKVSNATAGRLLQCIRRVS